MGWGRATAAKPAVEGRRMGVLFMVVVGLGPEVAEGGGEESTELKLALDSGCDALLYEEDCSLLDSSASKGHLKVKLNAPRHGRGTPQDESELPSANKPHLEIITG
ncbi:hypothetical protein BHE74_00027664 [Ensete ventricosum]|nr:hypothetical protein GW17_00008349 [Ensete ventricosum]RWW65050.1 hypothetical protein BHE74_00027664 [Ensete ventricosum]RZR88727.1 hypothetical protein BHM03_00016357 [Ensete ventricosum]